MTACGCPQDLKLLLKSKQVWKTSRCLLTRVPLLMLEKLLGVFGATLLDKETVCFEFCESEKDDLNDTLSRISVWN